MRGAARPEEDVVADTRLAIEAIDLGFPRLIVRDDAARLPSLSSRSPVLRLDAATLRRWDAERRSIELPPTRLEFSTRRLVTLIEIEALERTWVDGVLAELTRATGAGLPSALRGFARRILEFPVRYTNLHALADACGTSRGALKAKFRRRGLVSPSTYLRWVRAMAVAKVLADRSVTVAVAARRLGFTSDGNLCRMTANVCGMTPTELRTPEGWNRLLISFAWLHLSAPALEAWAEMDELFELRVA